MKVNLDNKNKEIPNLEKHACDKVAMETSSSKYGGMSYQDTKCDSLYLEIEQPTVGGYSLMSTLPVK